MVNVSGLDVPPPGARVNTVTWAVPTAEISAAEIAAVTPVAPTKVVVLLLPFHWTTEHGNKLLPITSKRNAAPPTVALGGLSEEMTGAGSVAGGVSVAGDTMVNCAEFEVTDAETLDTVTVAVPGNAASAAVIAAVSCVTFTNVVGRAEPFQFTTSPLAKFVPFTIRVKPEGLQYGVEDGESVLMVGATIENAIALDVPPPPPDVGLNTVTWAGGTAAAMSVADIAALSCVGPAYVVARVPPFHCTTEHGTKPLPVTFKLNPDVPAVAPAGKRDVRTGAGSAAGVDTLKEKEFELTEKLDTETCAVPMEAVSEAEIKAVSCVALTNVVARGELFQLTTEPFTKFVPFTVRVNPEELQDGVEDDEVVEEDNEVMAGGEIVNGTFWDVFPPDPTGGGVNKTT